MDATLSGTAIYEERQNFALLRMIALVAALVIGGTAYITNSKSGFTDPSEAWSLAFIAAMLLVVVWGFSRMSTTVNSAFLQFGFPVWHKRVEVSRIHVGEIKRIPMWYGLGIHYVVGIWVYNVHLGRGVVIAVDGRRYLIGSSDPERLQSALLQVAPRRENA